MALKERFPPVCSGEDVSEPPAATRDTRPQGALLCLIWRHVRIPLESELCPTSADMWASHVIGEMICNLWGNLLDGPLPEGAWGWWVTSSGPCSRRLTRMQ